MQETKDEIRKFINEKNKELKNDRKIKNIDFIKMFSYGKNPIACFEVETDDDEKGPYWLTYVSKEDSGIPNAIYNVNMFNHQVLEEMGIDVFLATFNFHVGMMSSGLKSMELLIEESNNATKH
jgi:hypothetical protein